MLIFKTKQITKKIKIIIIKSWRNSARRYSQNLVWNLKLDQHYFWGEEKPFPLAKETLTTFPSPFHKNRVDEEENEEGMEAFQIKN